MFSRTRPKRTARAMAATPTPSVNNIESVAVDEECVQLGYSHRGTEEQIKKEQERYTLYDTLYEGMIRNCEFRRRRPASWKACHNSISQLSGRACVDSLGPCLSCPNASARKGST